MAVVEATNIRYGKSFSSDVMHFTGGIRGHRMAEGWNIAPLLRDGKICELGPVPDKDIGQLSNQLGIALIGINQISFNDPMLLSQIWHPMIGAPHDQILPADIWGCISHNARIGGDVEYANLARNVAISLRAAGIRLRDASDGYYHQLYAGLSRGQSVNRRFKNISLSDLHLAFHSIAAELGAARDYLSAIIAMHVGAPTKIDSLSRLIEWVKKPINSQKLVHELVAPLIDGYDKGGRWLYDLGEYRKNFFHREPMGVNGTDRGVYISAAETCHEVIYILHLDIANPQSPDEKVEALDAFVRLSTHMQVWAALVATHAKYSSEPPNVLCKR